MRSLGKLLPKAQITAECARRSARSYKRYAFKRREIAISMRNRNIEAVRANRVAATVCICVRRKGEIVRDELAEIDKRRGYPALD